MVRSNNPPPTTTNVRRSSRLANLGAQVSGRTQRVIQLVSNSKTQEENQRNEVIYIQVSSFLKMKTLWISPLEDISNLSRERLVAVFTENPIDGVFPGRFFESQMKNRVWRKKEYSPVYHFFHSNDADSDSENEVDVSNSESGDDDEDVDNNQNDRNSFEIS
ncbi:unnamed protein product [Brachionus calyciflorus]|uniref:Uncharacterized protein n=1 Tax=Brachionus calyciflorus TaxID=104777 RepID=A0A814L6X8_9BILA|nr:unnamed protein product [Brachionus calyciflorus]